MFVIFQCFAKGKWNDEFADEFNTRKECMVCIQQEIKEWELCGISGKNSFVGVKNIVYMNNKPFYKYTIVPKLVGDRKNLEPY